MIRTPVWLTFHHSRRQLDVRGGVGAEERGWGQRGGMERGMEGGMERGRDDRLI